MNKAKGCFLTILSIFILVVVVIFCISIMDRAPGDGEQASSFFTQIFTSRNLLFLGVDEREGSNDFKGRTDTIIIFHIGNWGEKDTLISIPRDTRVYLEDHGWNKINAAYVYGGSEMLKSEIYELTNIDIDQVMLINFDGFKKIIDILGGVEIAVEEPLHDPLSGADFDPGTYLMDGDQALAFARTRATAKADLDRVDRQQYLLSELLRQKANSSVIIKIPQLLEVFNNETRSDFSFWDFCSVGFVLLFSNKDINRITIPTSPDNIEGISYLIADEEEVKEFLRDYIK